MTLTPLSFLAGLLVAVVAVVPLSHVAKRLGIVDVPSARKRHTGFVPLVGGTAIVLGLLVWLPFLPEATASSVAVQTLVVPMLLLGMVDDRFDLSARFRLALQMAFALVLAEGFDIRIETLDGIVSLEPILLGEVFATAFTVVCVVGVLNAVNMMDGADGLLGALSLTSLLAIGFLAAVSGREVEADMAAVLAGGILGYLLFNLGSFGERRKVFLGDSGSMIIGLVMAVLFIVLSQGERTAFSPTSAGWLLGLPLLDTVAVMVRRLAAGGSPFRAGRDHFHHMLIELGLGSRQVLAVMLFIHVGMVCVGLSVDVSGIAEPLYFWSFVALTVTHYFVTPKVLAQLARNSRLRV